MKELLNFDQNFPNYQLCYLVLDLYFLGIDSVLDEDVVLKAPANQMDVVVSAELLVKGHLVRHEGI